MSDPYLSKQVEKISDLSEKVSELSDSIATKKAAYSLSICINALESLLAEFQKIELVKHEKNMQDMEGYLNRHKDGLPKEKCLIVIHHKSINDPVEKRLCVWHPFNPDDYEPFYMPAKGFLGHATDVVKEIGFNVWEQNDSEFVFYKLVKEKDPLLAISNLL